jgi:hypothetical protein
MNSMKIVYGTIALRVLTIASILFINRLRAGLLEKA